MKNNKTGKIIEGLSKKRKSVTESAKVTNNKKEVVVNESPKNGDEVNFVRFVMKAYGKQKRKGISKPAYVHALDVVSNAELGDIDDVERSTRIYRVGMLHDMLEDNHIKPEKLAEMLDLDEQELSLLKLVSRNFDNEDNTSYIEGIVNNEDAVVIKFADRIANIKDLLLWIREEKGFNISSLKMATKYMGETEEMLELVDKRYPDLMKTSAQSGLAKQYAMLKNRLIDLERAYEKYENSELKESAVLEKVFDTDEYEIEQDDIQRTLDIIKRLYKESEELQKAYPDYLERLSKTIKKLEKKIEAEGFPYVRELFKKVDFSEDDFMTLYNNYVNDRLLDGLKQLGKMKEDAPKNGLKERLRKDLNLSVSELDDIISGDDKEGLMGVYKDITAMMDSVFDKIYDRLVAFAKLDNGDVVYRDGRYKNPDRAVVKYLESKKGKKGGDFLDLSDILGFRGRFDSVEDCIDFSVRVIKDKKESMFKVASYIGSGTAYQGVNLNFNHDGLFNYEVQSVFDFVQVGTDMNHDIIYKKLMKVSDEETRAVKMLVQICLGLMFDELFKFKK